MLSGEASANQQALDFAAATSERIRPIFDASLREDKNGIKQAQVVQGNVEREPAATLKARLKTWFGLAFGDALAWTARYNLHVFRGMMRTVNLVEKPGDFLSDPKTRRIVLLTMLRGRKRNARARVQQGPKRDEMLDFVASLSP